MKRILILSLMLLIATGIYAEPKQDKAKYVFFFIGDGMGVSEINATEAYLAGKDGKVGVNKLGFSVLPSLALVTTFATDRYVTDSAAAGTALATGNKTSVGTIAMDPSGKNKYKSIAEKAKEAGMKVGIISTVNMNDATPAVFYAHQPNRKMHKEISEELVNSNFDFFGGGWVKKSDIKEDLNKKGYIVTRGKKELLKVKGADKKVYATCSELDDDQACAYSIDQKSDELTLADIVSKATELLDNPKGFFVVAEAGKIDWANHSNDAVSAIYDVIELDKAVAVAKKFYDAHPNDTLIIVTSDHETGGLSQSSGYDVDYKTNLKLLAAQKRSALALDGFKKKNNNVKDLSKYIKSNFGLSDDELAKLDLNKENVSSDVTRMFNAKAGITWTTNEHTGMPVMAFSIGNGAETMTGYIDNTELSKKIMSAMGL